MGNNLLTIFIRERERERERVNFAKILIWSPLRSEASQFNLG